MSSLPKPVLRGHLRKSGLKMLGGAVIFAITTATLYKVLVGMPREKAYNEYIKTYDAEEHFNSLVKYGLLQSAKIAKEK